MKSLLFSVRDIAADAYYPPQAFGTIPLAIRWFSDVAKDPKSQTSKYPDQYELVHIGYFDSESGVVTPCKLNNMGNALQHLPNPSARNPEPGPMVS